MGNTGSIGNFLNSLENLHRGEAELDTTCDTTHMKT